MADVHAVCKCAAAHIERMASTVIPTEDVATAVCVMKVPTSVCVWGSVERSATGPCVSCRAPTSPWSNKSSSKRRFLFCQGPVVAKVPYQSRCVPCAEAEGPSGEEVNSEVNSVRRAGTVSVVVSIVIVELVAVIPSRLHVVRASIRGVARPNACGLPDRPNNLLARFEVVAQLDPLDVHVRSITVADSMRRPLPVTVLIEAVGGPVRE